MNGEMLETIGTALMAMLVVGHCTSSLWTASGDVKKMRMRARRNDNSRFVSKNLQKW